jgi:hypothetical protein
VERAPPDSICCANTTDEAIAIVAVAANTAFHMPSSRSCYKDANTNSHSAVAVPQALDGAVRLIIPSHEPVADLHRPLIAPRSG